MFFKKEIAMSHVIAAISTGLSVSAVILYLITYALAAKSRKSM